MEDLILHHHNTEAYMTLQEEIRAIVREELHRFSIEKGLDNVGVANQVIGRFDYDLKNGIEKYTSFVEPAEVKEETQEELKRDIQDVIEYYQNTYKGGAMAYLIFKRITQYYTITRKRD